MRSLFPRGLAGLLLHFTLCLAPVFASAQETPGAQSSFAGKDRMNGYSLKDFPDFQKDWHFVTVRYRKDTGEMRWTYANDLAWKALIDGGTHYPDGAVFAKIGLMTEEDPDFTSSAVPSGARRFQLMVKDSRKHTETDGWGYALFDTNGLTMPENPADQTAACHACHAVVPHRDYVFSQPVNLNIYTMAIFVRAPANEHISPEDLKGLTFETVPIDKLSSKLRGILPPGVTKVRMVQGPMRQHMFQGTIDEIRPTLAKEALTSKLPAALVNEKGDRFSLVLPVPGGEAGCSAPKGRRPVKLTARYTTAPAGDLNFPVQTIEFCEMTGGGR